MSRRNPAIALALVLALTLTAAACGDDDNDASAPAETSTTTTTAPTDEPVYAEPGPYTVGYTTLHMPDRDVAVWYPAADDAATGATKASYDQRAALPDSLKALVPDEYNNVVTMEAYEGAPPNPDGPFPVVLFSHGAGGYRLAYTALNAGIASWGFVVASLDYTERGLVAQVTGQRPPPDPERDPRLMLASLDLLTAENDNPESPLYGIVDDTQVGAVGHSAGGRTSYDALADPRLKVAVGWAPVGPNETTVVDKPAMIIGAEKDSGITPEDLAEVYAGLDGPKRLVGIGLAGHNSFTDVCVVIKAGGGLLEFARKNNLVSENLVALARNGCEEGDPDPAVIWPIVQHFTVAELRDALGIDPQPVGLGEGIEDAFGEIPVTIEEAGH